jgi:nicotinate phosphoribosyltransferase
MAVSDDAPFLDTVYKLTTYDGEGRMKLSTDKQTLPYRKQVFRESHDGSIRSDTVAMHEESLPGHRLLEHVMANGRRTDAGRDDLETARRRAKSQLETLPGNLRGIGPSDQPYKVAVSERLMAVTEALRSSLERD